MAKKITKASAAAVVGQRRLARRQIGRLADTLVKPRTAKAYDAAVSWFFVWLVQMSLGLPASVWEFDLVVCEAIEAAWQDGDNRDLVGNLLSGLSHKVPSLRGCLKGSWRLWNAWGRHELPARAPPLTPGMVFGLAGVLWSWELHDMAILVLLGFEFFLRTNELLSILVAHVTIGHKPGAVFVQLPSTKTTTRSGGVESVSCSSLLLQRLLTLVCGKLRPGDAILQRTPAQFRVAFDKALSALSLPLCYRPYSLRRGGATEHFRATGSMDACMERGRWRDARTARIYINTALMELSLASVSVESRLKIDAAAAFLRGQLLPGG